MLPPPADVHISGETTAQLGLSEGLCTQPILLPGSILPAWRYAQHLWWISSMQLLIGHRAHRAILASDRDCNSAKRSGRVQHSNAQLPSYRRHRCASHRVGRAVANIGVALTCMNDQYRTILARAEALRDPYQDDAPLRELVSCTMSELALILAVISRTHSGFCAWGLLCATTVALTMPATGQCSLRLGLHRHQSTGLRVPQSLGALAVPGKALARDSLCRLAADSVFGQSHF